jgi:NAD+ synthase (glutamine-hydrolysing)
MTIPISRPTVPLRAGLVQFRPRKADPAGNLQAIRDMLSGAAGRFDLLVFPEAALTGYFLEGGVLESALSLEQVASGLGTPSSGAPDVVVGFYERWRHRLHNSVAWFTPEVDGWRVVHVHRKLFLPTYGVFDEARFVEAGRELQAFDTRLGRAGLLVCEDAWHSLPPAVLALDGAEVVVVASASPARGFEPGHDGRPGNLRRWEALAPGIAVEHGVFVLVSQLVGSEGGKLFPGGAMAVGPDGTVLARGPIMEEGVVSVVLDGGEIERARFHAPLLADLEMMLPHLRRALGRVERSGPRSHRGEGVMPPHLPAEATLGGSDPRAIPSPGPRPGDLSPLDVDLPLVERALVAFIRDEVVRRRGFRKVVLGISGGVDSAVSLFLAVRALGAENVHGFRMPYATSSQESLDHARLAMEATGAVERTIEITEAVDAYVAGCEPDISPLRRGNLAARFRALTLFDQSAALSAIPLGTGNKSERLLGYYTWHADDSPPVNPLGDLLKTQVWALARHLGVPDEIVEKPASADLVRGVHDEDELGIAYHRADPLLHWFLKGYPPDELVRRGFPAGDVELVWRRLNSTHWKRELPTVAILSESAIGAFYLRPVDF